MHLTKRMRNKKKYLKNVFYRPSALSSRVCQLFFSIKIFQSNKQISQKCGKNRCSFCSHFSLNKYRFVGPKMADFVKYWQKKKKDKVAKCKIWIDQAHRIRVFWLVGLFDCLFFCLFVCLFVSFFFCHQSKPSQNHL